MADRYVKVTGYLRVHESQKLERVASLIVREIFLEDVTVTEAPDVKPTKHGLRRVGK